MFLEVSGVNGVVMCCFMGFLESSLLDHREGQKQNRVALAATLIGCYDL